MLLSLVFLYLTALVVTFSLISVRDETHTAPKTFFALVFLLEGLLFAFFSVRDSGVLRDFLGGHAAASIFHHQYVGIGRSPSGCHEVSDLHDCRVGIDDFCCAWRVFCRSQYLSISTHYLQRLRRRLMLLGSAEFFCWPLLSKHLFFPSTDGCRMRMPKLPLREQFCCRGFFQKRGFTDFCG